MNWLAHVYLSEPRVEFQLGNLLADIVKRPSVAEFGDDFVRGAARHRAIDAFTDAHACVQRSRARISARYRRFSGVLVDIFYDHFLASGWNVYADTPLDTFTGAFYEASQNCDLPLPADARRTVDSICRYDLLSSYADITGVEEALKRLSHRLAARWGRDFALELSVGELQAQNQALRADFAEFFPTLRSHVTAVSS